MQQDNRGGTRPGAGRPKNTIIRKPVKFFLSTEETTATKIFVNNLKKGAVNSK